MSVGTKTIDLCKTHTHRVDRTTLNRTKLYSAANKLCCVVGVKYKTKSRGGVEWQILVGCLNKFDSLLYILIHFWANYNKTWLTICS